MIGKREEENRREDPRPAKARIAATGRADVARLAPPWPPCLGSQTYNSAFGGSSPWRVFVRNEANLARLRQRRVSTGERCKTNPIGPPERRLGDKRCCTNKPNSCHHADPEIGVPGRAERAKQSQTWVPLGYLGAGEQGAYRAKQSQFPAGPDGSPSPLPSQLRKTNPICPAGPGGTGSEGVGQVGKTNPIPDYAGSDVAWSLSCETKPISAERPEARRVDCAKRTQFARVDCDSMLLRTHYKQPHNSVASPPRPWGLWLSPAARV
jgi:hypothetical protein